MHTFQITNALNRLGHDKRTVSSVKSLWDNLLKTAKKEISGAKISNWRRPSGYFIRNESGNISYKRILRYF